MEFHGAAINAKQDAETIQRFVAAAAAARDSILSLLVASGMSQSEIARHLGVSRQAVSARLKRYRRRQGASQER